MSVLIAHYIVFLFVLLFLSLSVHFFRPFHISSYFISLTSPFKEPPPFFCHALFFVLSFLLCLLFAYFVPFFARSTFTDFPLFRGKSFVSSSNRVFRLCCPPRLWFYEFFPSVKPPGIKLPTNLNLALRVRMTGAVTLFSQHAFMTWTGTTLLFCLLQTAQTQCQPHLGSLIAAFLFRLKPKCAAECLACRFVFELPVSILTWRPKNMRVCVILHSHSSQMSR
jgi:ABC-type multidrug transport system fused ATPase/permease subunit